MAGDKMFRLCSENGKLEMKIIIVSVFLLFIASFSHAYFGTEKFGSDLSKFGTGRFGENGSGGGEGSGPSNDALLLETGDYLLFETGDFLLLE